MYTFKRVIAHLFCFNFFKIQLSFKTLLKAQIVRYWSFFLQNFIFCHSLEKNKRLFNWISLKTCHCYTLTCRHIDSRLWHGLGVIFISTGNSNIFRRGFQVLGWDWQGASTEIKPCCLRRAITCTQQISYTGWSKDVIKRKSVREILKYFLIESFSIYIHIFSRS